jgi:8-oxo-dGTP diphosphatase
MSPGAGGLGRSKVVAELSDMGRGGSDGDTWFVDDHRVVAAILREGDRVLLCHRSPSRRWYPDVWDFPGGHVEPGESATDALRRELREELGVHLGSVDGEPIFRKTDPHDGLDLTVWVCSSWIGAVQNCEPKEHDAIGWFGVDELGGLEFADPSYLSMLQRVLGTA